MTKIFYLPDLGEGLAEAEIREWYVKEGDAVTVDQPLVSMETAKAVVDVPSPYTGKIVKLHGKANDVIKTGAPLISYESSEAKTDDKPKHSVVGALEESSSTWSESDVVIGQARSRTSGAIKAMPAARVLAKEMNIDLAQLTPTGPNGLITVQDVKKMLTTQSSGVNLAKSTMPGQTETLHGVRRSMAKAMTLSHREVVPVTIIEDVDITNLPAQSDITTRIIMAMVAAAKAEPSLNAWFDGSSEERKLFNEVNIGLAVDTDEGLFVPVIKKAEQKDATKIREEINHFKTAVKERRVAPADMQGATITLSNFGMIAGKYATPIIVPPTVAILGCGRSREMAVVREGKLQAGKIMPLSLTFDHRSVTGGEATRFLGTVIKYIEGKL